LLTSAQTKLLGLLSPLTEFGAVARTYPVACSGVRQLNFDYGVEEYKKRIFEAGDSEMTKLFKVFIPSHNMLIE
jgi:hypothetical protein